MYPTYYTFKYFEEDYLVKKKSLFLRLRKEILVTDN